MIDSPNPLCHQDNTPSLEICICLIARDCVQTEYSWSSCWHKGYIFKCCYPIFKILFLSLKRLIDFIGSTIWDTWLAGDCMDYEPQISRLGKATENTRVRVLQSIMSLLSIDWINMSYSYMCDHFSSGLFNKLKIHSKSTTKFLLTYHHVLFPLMTPCWPAHAPGSVLVSGAVKWGRLTVQVTHHWAHIAGEWGGTGWTDNLLTVPDPLGSLWQPHTSEWQHQNWSQV